MMHDLILSNSQHKTKPVMNIGLYSLIFSPPLEKEVSQLILMIGSVIINS